MSFGTGASEVIKHNNRPPAMDKQTSQSVELSAKSSKVGPYAMYVLLVLTLVYVINCVDRQMLSILAEDVKRDLRLNDAQVGFLYGTAFAVFYAIFGIPLARLADNWRRGWLLGLGLGVWSGMTALSGLAGNYIELAIARTGVGIGEAAGSPPAFSLIADYFPKDRRAFALSIYSAGAYLGGGMSLPLGGAVSSKWNQAFAVGHAPLGLAGWQAAFLILGLPGLLLAAWVFTLREPLRGASEGAGSPVVRAGAWHDFARELAAVVPPFTLFSVARLPGGLIRNLALLAIIASAATGFALITHDVLQWTVYGVGLYAVASWVQAVKRTDYATWRLTWGTPAFVMLLLAVGSTAAVQYASTFWAAPYVLRTFYANPDVSGHILTAVSAREEVGYFAVGSTAGAVLGVLFGGWLSDRLRMRDVRGRLLVIALSPILYIPTLAILYTTKSLTVFYAFEPLLGAAGAISTGAAIAAFQELVLPRMRATSGALMLLSTAMVGFALGPYASGKMAAITGSLTAGIFSLYLLVPLILVLLWSVSRQLGSAEATREERACELLLTVGNEQAPSGQLPSKSSLY